MCAGQVAFSVVDVKAGPNTDTRKTWWRASADQVLIVDVKGLEPLTPRV